MPVLTFSIPLDMVLAAIARGDFDADLEGAHEQVLGAFSARWRNRPLPDLYPGDRVRISRAAPAAYRGLAGTVRTVGRGLAVVVLDAPPPGIAPEVTLARYALLLGVPTDPRPEELCDRG